MFVEVFAYPTVTVVCFTDQNWISKTVYCTRCVMVCKIFPCSEFPKRMQKTGKYKAFCTISNFSVTGADRHNGILISLGLLVSETITLEINCFIKFIINTQIMFRPKLYLILLLLFFLEWASFVFIIYLERC